MGGGQQQSYQFYGQGQMQLPGGTAVNIGPGTSSSSPYQQQSNVNPSSKPMKCLSCDTWCGTYEMWLGHLTSESHQKTVASDPQELGHESWREESLRRKCLIVSGVRGLPIGPIVTYLAKWGTILDFIRQQENTYSSNGPEGYFVLYESE